jgi:phospholipid/cholesterol/gamma-HCH transport system ATP-binding protein
MPVQLPELPAADEVEMREQPLDQTLSADRGSALGSPVEIRIENLYKSFGDRDVLDGISLEVHRGEMIAVVGGSGSSKTTLLRHIIGLDRPDKGRVLIADHESQDSSLVDLGALDATKMERLQRHWAAVFQGNALLSGMTVAYNIALPLREVQHLDESTICSRVDQAVREVALDPIKDLSLTIGR